MLVVAFLFSWFCFFGTLADITVSPDVVMAMGAMVAAVMTAPNAMSALGGRLLTRAEAAAYLGIAPQTLALWASSGRYDLPFIRVGRCVRYRLSDLDAFLESRTRTHTGQPLPQ